MKLKSLLLGSAAAMIAVTGARAADAVIAEPEPMEYVKFCDMYGAGFFYIPGTETCLRMDGYVRTDASYNVDRITNTAASSTQVVVAPGGAAPAAPAGGTVDVVLAVGAATAGVYVVNTPASTARNDDLAWSYRARINFDARNETDWGTLRSEIRLQGDGDGGGDANVGLDRALISLAGFRLGYSDSFTTTFHGYGLPIEKNDGYYGYDQAMFFDYTYTANGFSLGLGIQRSVANAVNDTDVDLYAGASYAGSWGNVAASYIHETDIDEGAYKVSARITAFEGLDLRGFYLGSSANNTRAINNNNGTAVRGADWAWGVGASYAVTDTVTLAAVYSDADAANVSYFAVGANWTPVPGLRISPEARFNEDDSEQYTIRVYRTW